MHRKRRRAGLSAIEVLLVLIIIAIVGAILFPVFAKARQPARHQTCQSNLKECALAIQLYWGDYDAVLPSSQLVSYAGRWNRPSFRTFATRTGKLPARSPIGRSWVQIVYDKMKSKDIMFCPSDPANRNDPKSSCSYWWKTAIDKAWFGVGCVKPCRKEGDFAYNADIIMLYEHKGWHYGQLGGLKNGVQINVAFMDTHVKTITVSNATSGDPINCAANSDGEPMYSNFDNEREKGPGNPPAANVPAKYVDPSRCSDLLP